MAIELETLAVGFALEPVEMPLEIRDALFGVEIHADFKIGRRGHSPYASRDAWQFATPGRIAPVDCAS